MRWTVTSQARDRVSGRIVPFKGRADAPRRIEIIDTDKWGFGPVRTPEEVKRLYEAFWNEMPTTPPLEVIEVLEVVPADDAIA